MSKGVLMDTTRCIGCRACQVACKQWNDLPAEDTRYEGQDAGYQNPPRLTASTYSVVTFNEIEDPKAPGGLQFVFNKHQCMHCADPACASACPVTALHRNEDGAVTYEAEKCIGCRYCVWACPFNVPTAEWDNLAPRIRKCEFCADRMDAASAPEQLNDKPLSDESKVRFMTAAAMPACVKACTTGAILFGEREDLLKEAKKRVFSNPDRYVPYVYGERDVGGTAFLYISSVPFEKIGLRMDLGERSIPSYSEVALGAVPAAVVGLGGFLAGYHWLVKRRKAVSDEDAAAQKEG